MWSLSSSSSSSSLPPTPLHHPSPSPNRTSPLISFSTNPKDLNILHLRDLLHVSNHSCLRFPGLSSDGLVDKVDAEKLCVAVDNSSVVVSAFCRDKYCDDEGEGEVCSVEKFGFEHLFERAVRMIPAEEERRLVGFGRAVSDGGLTASIHDVVVTPSLQRLGIARKIIQIITGVYSYLTGKGIYDISALCSEEERHFFQACGFGKDYLGATTMMYTRTASTEQESDVKSFGGITLLVPPFIRE